MVIWTLHCMVLQVDTSVLEEHDASIFMLDVIRMMM